MTGHEEISKALLAIRHNRAIVEASRECGCVNCLTIYEVSENFDWVDKDELSSRWTALCQLCDEPFVIGDAAGLPLSSDDGLLDRLYDPLVRFRLNNAQN
ncbi:MAG TPA: hypothetical protein VHG29_03240 [Novosphingobium sp.]|nr:hypothetical protein [Novosphingobium sp.]